MRVKLDFDKPKKYRVYFDNIKSRFKPDLSCGEEQFTLKPYKNIIPFMVSKEDGCLICFERTRDAPTIAIVGSKRSGKTIIYLNLLSRFFYYTNDKIVIASDCTNETVHLNQPQLNKEWRKILELFGEIPRPLPLVHLYPNTRDLSIGDSKKHINVKTTLPLDDFLYNISKFMELDKSGEYLKSIVPDLLKEDKKNLFNNFDEVVGRLLKGKLSKKIHPSVLGKISVYVGNVFRDGLVDIGQSDCYSSFETKFDKKSIKDIPMISSMYAGIIPTLMTNDLIHKENYPPYYAFHLDAIKQNQYKPFFKNNKIRVMAFTDETESLFSRESAVALICIKEWVLRGGPIRGGYVYSTQNFSQVPQPIRNNTKYIITTSHSLEEAKVICSSIGVNRKYAQDISNLNSNKHECIAITKERFVAIDLRNGKKKFIYGLVRGVFLPPLCNSYPPEVDEDDLKKNFLPENYDLPKGSTNYDFSIRYMKSVNTSIKGLTTKQKTPVTIKREPVKLNIGINLLRDFLGMKEYGLEEVSYNLIEQYGWHIYIGYDNYGSYYKLIHENEKKLKREKLSRELPNNLFIKMDLKKRMITLIGPGVMEEWKKLDFKGGSKR